MESSVVRKRREAEGLDVPAYFRREYGKKGASSLVRLASIFALNPAEVGRLFGVSRQAVNEWRRKGVPMARVADVGRVAALADALYGRFVPERLPQIVRSALPGLGNVTILETIATRGSGSVFELLDDAFSWTP